MHWIPSAGARFRTPCVRSYDIIRRESREAPLPCGDEVGDPQAETQGWLAVPKSLSFQVLLPHEGELPS